MIRQPGSRLAATICAFCLIYVAALFLAGPGYADDGVPPPSILSINTLWQGPDNQYVTTVAADSTGWWWGTDNDGLWHFAPSAKPGRQYEHIRAEDGLYDDSISALCIDRHGRLWVGTERHGVSVYNGKWWRNYDFMDGPLGVHIKAISLCPANGDIYIASETGLAIYANSTNQWNYVTTANGLSSNQLNCIAFTPSGKVVIGTADTGLLIGTTFAGKRKWTSIKSADTSSTTEDGPGLPGDQINCIEINTAGKIFIGTSEGLATSADDGATFTYLHGYLWQQCVTLAIRKRHPVNQENDRPPLSDQYVSALAFDRSGLLLIGHRKSGLEIYDDAKGTPLYHSQYNAYGVTITTLCSTSSGQVLIGNYGSGLSVQSWQQSQLTEDPSEPKVGIDLQLPTSAAPPAAADVQNVLTSATRKAGSGSPELSYFLGEDWQTQGDWIGRYGGEYAVLCGESGNQDLVLSSDPVCSVAAQVGRAYGGETDVSHWVQWPVSYDPRVLFDPTIGTRRESEWDDRGEKYNTSREGPDLWLTIRVPAGVHRLSLYFMNKDGHSATTRFRDYIVELRQFVNTTVVAQTYADPDQLPVLAHTRVEGFWPGVYESFVIDGPGSYYVKVDKNGSLNTVVQGVFLDRLDNPAAVPAPVWLHGVRFGPSPQRATAMPLNHNVKVSAGAASLDEIKRAWAELDILYANKSGADMEREDRVLLLRAAVAANAPESLLAEWRWSLGLWVGDDWSNFNKATDQLNAATAKTK